MEIIQLVYRPVFTSMDTVQLALALLNEIGYRLTDGDRY